MLYIKMQEWLDMRAMQEVIQIIATHDSCTKKHCPMPHAVS